MISNPYNYKKEAKLADKKEKKLPPHYTFEITGTYYKGRGLTKSVNPYTVTAKVPVHVKANVLTDTGTIDDNGIPISKMVNRTVHIDEIGPVPHLVKTGVLLELVKRNIDPQAEKLRTYVSMSCTPSSPNIPMPSSIESLSLAQLRIFAKAHGMPLDFNELKLKSDVLSAIRCYQDSPALYLKFIEVFRRGKSVDSEFENVTLLLNDMAGATDDSEELEPEAGSELDLNEL